VDKTATLSFKFDFPVLYARILSITLIGSKRKQVGMCVMAVSDNNGKIA
jgi:hypothetical protein